MPYEFPPRSSGPRSRPSANDDDDAAEHSASTSAQGPGGRLSPFSALSQGDVAATAAASQPSSRRSSLAPFQPSPRRSRAEDAGPPLAAPARRSSLGIAGRSASTSSRAHVVGGVIEQEQKPCGDGEQHCAWRGDTSSSAGAFYSLFFCSSWISGFDALSPPAASPAEYVSPITPVRPHSAGSSPHSSPEDPIPSEYRLGSSTSTSGTPTSARPAPARSSFDSAVELSALGPQSVFAPAFHPAVMGTGAGRGFQPRPRPGEVPQPMPQYLPAPAPARPPQPHPSLYSRPPPPPQRQLYVPPPPTGMTITLSSDDEDEDEDDEGEGTTATTSGSASGGRQKRKQRGKKKKKGRRGAGGGGGGGPGSGASKEEDPLAAAAGGSLSRLSLA